MGSKSSVVGWAATALKIDTLVPGTAFDLGGLVGSGAELNLTGGAQVYPFRTAVAGEEHRKRVHFDPQDFPQW